MNNEDKLLLVAPCGLYCGDCPLYKARTDNTLAEKVAKQQGIPVEQLPVCLGCRAQQGHIPVMGEPICGTYDCVINQNALNFCYECEDFPCLKLAPSADRAQVFPHNSKIYNLLLLQKLGLENWLQKANELWRQYFRSKKPRGGDEIQM